MLLEPITPLITGMTDPLATGVPAVDRARAARAWLDLGVHVANRPGFGDPTPRMTDALHHATEAIREAIEACGELHEVRDDLHLALDEATEGLVALAQQGADGRTAATRTANLAGGILDRAIAALDEYHGTTPDPDAEVR